MAKDKEDRLNERIVVLVPEATKEAYTAMCDAIGENMSEHIRQSWEAELALYRASIEDVEKEPAL